MPSAAREADIRPPAVLVVGGVVELAGHPHVVGEPAPVGQNRGGDPVPGPGRPGWWNCSTPPGPGAWRRPPSRSCPPADFAPLDAALQHLSRYDWVIFTSANGVGAFMGRLFHMGLDVRALGRARLAVIGPATAEALRQYSLMADVVPDTFQAEGLLKDPGAAIAGRDTPPPGPGRASPGRAARRPDPVGR